VEARRIPRQRLVAGTEHRIARTQACGRVCRRPVQEIRPRASWHERLRPDRRLQDAANRREPLEPRARAPRNDGSADARRARLLQPANRSGTISGSAACLRRTRSEHSRTAHQRSRRPRSARRGGRLHQRDAAFAPSTVAGALWIDGNGGRSIGPRARSERFRSRIPRTSTSHGPERHYSGCSPRCRSRIRRSTNIADNRSRSR